MRKARAKPKKTNTRWFIEPYDDTTNKVIAMNMASTGRSADESVQSSYPDECGVLHQVWEVLYSDITRFSASATNADLKFRVYSMPPGARNIHEFPFSSTHDRVRKSAPVRDMKKKLANLK
jgi:hypothetical protein